MELENRDWDSRSHDRDSEAQELDQDSGVPRPKNKTLKIGPQDISRPGLESRELPSLDGKWCLFLIYLSVLNNVL